MVYATWSYVPNLTLCFVTSPQYVLTVCDIRVTVSRILVF